MPLFGALFVAFWFAVTGISTSFSPLIISTNSLSFSSQDNIPTATHRHTLLHNSLFSSLKNDTVQIIRLIEWLEIHTDYKILYRESEIHGIFSNVTEEHLANYAQILGQLNNSERIEQTLRPIREAFELAASQHGILIQWDSSSRQIILYSHFSTSSAFPADLASLGKNNPSLTLSLSIDVRDNLSGVSLELSQVGYRFNQDKPWLHLLGSVQKLVAIPVSAENGRYSSLVDSLHLLVYHVGYAMEEISLPLAPILSTVDGSIAQVMPITIRLTPKALYSNEVVIWGKAQGVELGNEMYDYVQTDVFGTTGEAHTTRSLQQLASVGLSGAVSDGMYVRGSDPTGFKVLLDRQQAYHDHHMFGVIDAMVSDALQPSAFYYNSVPARYSAPIGGLLDLNTRSGNRQNFRLSSNLSNAAFSLTTEGPMLKAKSSWLISARHSIYDHVPQLSPTNLIHYGLNIDRRFTFKLDSETIDPSKLSLPFTQATINSLDHSFYDLHGSWNVEVDPTSIWSMSFYRSSDDATMSYRYPINSNPDSTYNAGYSWNASHVVVEHHKEIPSHWIMYLKFGLSLYETAFSKDDYEYQVSELFNLGYNPGTVSALFMQNDVRDLNILHSWSYSNQGHMVEAGLSYTDYAINFTERSLVIPSFISNTSSQLLEAYLQWDRQWSNLWQSSLGYRGQYYSSGKQFHLNPNLLIRYQTDRFGSYLFTASQTHQYTHKLELYNQKSLDFWILTQEKQQPTQMSQLTLGWEHSKNNLHYRSEIYLKTYSDLRLHQLNAGLMSSLYSNSESTWLNETNGDAKGWEHYIHYERAQQSFWLRYTWAQVRLKNTLINQAAEYDAPWDRRHQATFNQSYTLTDEISLHIQGIAGTGTPALYGETTKAMDQRLPAYLRWDTHIKFSKVLKTSTFTAHLSLFNLFNRDNVWYSDRIQANYTHGDDTIQIYPQRQVFDLGFYPSFRIRYAR